MKQYKVKLFTMPSVLKEIIIFHKKENTKKLSGFPESFF